MRHLLGMWTEYISAENPPQLDRWIAAKLAENKGFGKKDRRFYSDAMFAAVRHGLFAFAASSGDGDGLVALCERAAAVSGWDTFRRGIAASDQELFFRYVFARAGMGGDESIIRRCRVILDDVRSAKTVESEMFSHSIPFSISELVSLRCARWDENETMRFFEMLDTRPPLWIRINDTDDIQGIVTSLEADGFQVDRVVGNACAVKGDPALYHSAAFRDGRIEIQDYASQMIGGACDIAPGMYVWDACAGGGGKTMQIASALKGKGAVYASDIREYKLEETKRRARKAGFSNVRTLPWNGDSLPAFPKEISVRKGFHRVLVDAPCSASGTWRRNPDAKYRINRHSVDELSDLQLSILHRASEAVREDGKLVYATCSFFTVENEDVVGKFLSANRNFFLEKAVLHGSPVDDADTTFTAVFSKK